MENESTGLSGDRVAAVDVCEQITSVLKQQQAALVGQIEGVTEEYGRRLKDLFSQLQHSQFDYLPPNGEDRKVDCNGCLPPTTVSAATTACFGALAEKGKQRAEESKINTSLQFPSLENGDTNQINAGLQFPPLENGASKLTPPEKGGSPDYAGAAALNGGLKMTPLENSGHAGGAALNGDVYQPTPLDRSGSSGDRKEDSESQKKRVSLEFDEEETKEALKNLTRLAQGRSRGSGVVSRRSASNGHGHESHGDRDLRPEDLYKLRAKSRIPEDCDDEATEEESAKSKTRFQRFRKYLQEECLSSPKFDFVVFLLISTNTALVGAEVNHRVLNPGEPIQGFAYADFCYTFFFSVELLMRIIAEGSGFCGKENLYWNFFDCFVVGTSILDAVITTIAVAISMDVTHMRVVRIFRVVRLLRTLRMIRLVRFIRALRSLIHSILVTLKSLVWAMLLLVMIFYGFGVAFIQAVADHYFEDNERVMDPEIQKHWGSLDKAMYTLFVSITGGMSWTEAITPLFQLGALWVTLFIFFITFAVFAVLNVITGVFCQSAIESAQMDKEMVTMHMMANKKFYMQALVQLFSDIDTDHSGQITIAEFEAYLDKEKCRLFLDALDINTQDAWGLFKMLDADQQGTLELEEFVEGCMNIKGPAKAMHFTKMEHDNKALATWIEKSFEKFDSMLTTIVGRSVMMEADISRCNERLQRADGGGWRDDSTLHLQNDSIEVRVNSRAFGEQTKRLPMLPNEEDALASKVVLIL